MSIRDAIDQIKEQVKSVVKTVKSIVTNESLLEEVNKDSEVVWGGDCDEFRDEKRNIEI